MTRHDIEANIIVAATLCLSVLLGLPGLAAAQQAKSSEKPTKPAPAAAQTNGDNTLAPTTIVGRGTTNSIPVFTGSHTINNSLLTQPGNGITVSGTVGAVGFNGDGSALTNVAAVQLGGLPASAYAQTGASNIFSTDQTINGNLNLTGYLDGMLFLQPNVTDQNGQQSSNVINGFAGNAQYPGNSIAPGVIGATIAGGGGVYESSSASKHLALTKPALGRRQALSNPFGRRSLLQGNSGQTSDVAGRPQQSPPQIVLVPGPNTIQILGNWATISGGLNNTASAAYATIGGGESNAASATEATIAGGSYNTASDVNSTVGGGYENTASGYVDGAGSATVAGGANNSATADWSTVGGGQSNVASGGNSTVAGGVNNTAEGVTLTCTQGVCASTVGGGISNVASGSASTVPGGALNIAAGDYSFAAGCGASANYIQSFVWSGGGCFSTGSINDTGAGQFVAWAPGGFYFYTQQTGGTAVGAALASGSGSWSNLSDRSAKENFLAIDPSSLLEKLAAMPVWNWNYKTQADSIRHLGPTAQDFHQAFGLGEDDKHISTVDAEGVALAGIQALYSELKRSLAEKDREISDLRARLAQLEQSAGRH